MPGTTLRVLMGAGAASVLAPVICFTAFAAASVADGSATSKSILSTNDDMPAFASYTAQRRNHHEKVFIRAGRRLTPLATRRLMRTQPSTHVATVCRLIFKRSQNFERTHVRASSAAACAIVSFIDSRCFTLS